MTLTVLLLKQAHQEALNSQMGQDKFILAMENWTNKKLVIKHPVQFTPFSFPIMVRSIESHVDLIRKYWRSSGKDSGTVCDSGLSFFYLFTSK